MSQGLIVQGLVRSFAGRVVVNDVSFGVRPGEVVGLLGPNGAGKTTCFRIVAGLDVGTAGTVQMDGQSLDGLALWRRVQLGLGYLSQEPSVFRRLSVRDNIRIPLERSGTDMEPLEPHIAKAGLEAVADAPAGTLSGGERRRLEIARCLAARPKYVLLDEPFSGVDPVAVTELQGRIREMSRDGLGVLLTDHAVREALGICDTVVILDGGRVMATGDPEAVSADPHVRARYLGPDFAYHSV